MNKFPYRCLVPAQKQLRKKTTEFLHSPYLHLLIYQTLQNKTGNYFDNNRDSQEVEVMQNYLKRRFCIEDLRYVLIKFPGLYKSKLEYFCSK